MSSSLKSIGHFPNFAFHVARLETIQPLSTHTRIRLRLRPNSRDKSVYVKTLSKKVVHPCRHLHSFMAFSLLLRCCAISAFERYPA